MTTEWSKGERLMGWAVAAAMAGVIGYAGGTLAVLRHAVSGGADRAEVRLLSGQVSEHTVELRAARRAVEFLESDRVKSDLMHLKNHAYLVGQVRCVQDTLKMLPPHQSLPRPAEEGIPPQKLPTRPVVD